MVQNRMLCATNLVYTKYRSKIDALKDLQINIYLLMCFMWCVGTVPDRETIYGCSTNW